MLDLQASNFHCQGLLVRFHRLVDDNRGADASTLFAADARYVVGSSAVVGREAIREALAARDAENKIAVHVLAGFDFELVSDDEAEAVGRVVVHRLLPSPGEVATILGEYRSRFVHRDETWLIQEHTVTALSL